MTWRKMMKSLSRSYLKKRATRALKKAIDLAMQEPSQIMLSVGPNQEAKSSLDDVRDWLFHRRQHNGRTKN
jgi:hypothetical protein